MFAQVIVDITSESVARPFTYRIPEGMALQPGCRVRIPFGRRTEEGIVLSLTDTCDLPADKLRDILAPLDDYPAVLPALMELARDLAAQVHCPLSETLRLMLPAQMRGGRVRVKEEPYVRLAIPAEELPAAVAAQGRSRKRQMLLRLLQDGEAHPVSELRLLVREPHDAIEALREMGYVTLSMEEVLRTPEGFAQPAQDDPPLTEDQEEVLGEILPQLRQGKGQFLLHGVTGSGKTEVFIRLVRRTLEAGRSAVILVPEIALTPQMVGWFRARFGPVAAVLHSRLSAGERYDEWRRIRRGDARVVIGARSAVFAPTEKLGLLVVDEEHEATYLSDHHPRYDAREVARMRCAREGATLLLASATPSILSFAMARRGDYTLLEMPRRVFDRPMPEVELVDMRRELASGNRSVLSVPLQEALRRCMRDRQQAMLLINHRGYHSFVSCRSCGHVMKCPNCDIALTYHLGGGDGQLHCHYCGHAEPPPEKCPACGSAYIRFFGAGTQKVEEEVRRLLPDVATVRMDIDTTSGKNGHQRLLDEFRSGQARVLIGTQMIAKGHDFPQVTLVGVVAADMTLNLPDYRSRERTFQLLTQVAGRAGRGAVPGRVIVQTYRPEDEIIRAAAAQDYRQFFRLEFDRRRAGLYPPFTVMARLLVESASQEDAREEAARLHARVRQLLEAHPEWARRTLMCRLDQPGVTVLRGRQRWHVLFKLLVHADTEAFAAALTELAAAPPEREGVQVVFEYNPTTMM